ncbi:hypothetical protein [Spongiactinospora rosea]|uniref:hypothetical protein n=1 Tax=Spongiactinospora rosea TaxID=2248750 RepID=UPI001314103D|nr:hypothetical protein [Spongiactinospora rosea]
MSGSVRSRLGEVEINQCGAPPLMLGEQARAGRLRMTVGSSAMVSSAEYGE